MNTIARDFADKREFLRKKKNQPGRKHADPSQNTISTPRLFVYMLGTGMVCGAIWYVSFVLGISRLTPPSAPQHIEHQHAAHATHTA
ncbi:hypothetical protein [Pararobbsia silviterrae]|uniref:Uncharacterized protein n=1 Tax=Pararobbsia silviterrae TaxID=1792498 RepID=A0A494X1X7_9BURK|nr:hypothetical protein [Pararobbsia silviterrae]RKP44738.1 hypothetical protein D7S86_27335 [Pararobbsia silviterrae]